MNLESLVRAWVEADKAMHAAALAGPSITSPEWPAWREAVFHDLCAREIACRDALHAWVAAHPAGTKCEHCPDEGTGTCSVCTRAA